MSTAVRADELPPAETDTAQAGAADEASAQTGVSLGGLWIFLDPLTGEVLQRPTAEQAAWRSSQRQQQEWLNKSSEGLEAFELEDGGRGVNLKGRFRHSLVVTMTPDGQFITTCSDHPSAPPHMHHHPKAGEEKVNVEEEAAVR